MPVTRETCKACWAPSAVGFNVPDEIWRAVRPEGLAGDVLCLACFTRLADEQLIVWDEQIEFHPVSLATHLGIREPGHARLARG
jgi:hypothetical protein